MGHHCSSKQSEKEKKNLESRPQRIPAEDKRVPAGSDKCEHNSESPTPRTSGTAKLEPSVQLCSQKILCTDSVPVDKRKIISFNIRYKNPFKEEERQLRKRRIEQDRMYGRVNINIRSKKTQHRSRIQKGDRQSFLLPVTGERRHRNLRKVYARSARGFYRSESSESSLVSSEESSYVSRQSRRSMYNIPRRRPRREFYSEGGSVKESVELSKPRRRKRRYRGYSRTHPTLPRVRDASSASINNSSIIPLVNEPLVNSHNELKPVPQDERIKESQQRNQKNIVIRPSSEGFPGSAVGERSSGLRDLNSLEKEDVQIKKSPLEQFQMSERQALPATEEAAASVPSLKIAGNGSLSREKFPSAPPAPEPAQQQAQAEASGSENSAELTAPQAASQSPGPPQYEKAISSIQAQQRQVAEEEVDGTRLRENLCSDK